MDTVVIVGVGLIGGSFSLALRRAGYQGRILGVSRPEVLGKALVLGVIDSGLSLEEAVPQADLVYLSQSIGSILEVIPVLQPLLKPGALVTDAGSTKSAIVEAANRSIPPRQFLGGHPLAGKETRGVESASADLFERRSYVLTPSFEEDLEAPAAREFTEWLQAMGATVILMNPKDHDRTLALTSHLPQLASTALATLLGRSEGQVQSAFGPGLLDVTRLALSSYDIWKDILFTNHEEVDRVLGDYIAVLNELRTNLNDGGLEQNFSDGAEFASKVRRR